MLVVCVCTLTVSFKPLLIQSFFFAFFQYVCLQQSSRHFGKKKPKKKQQRDKCQVDFAERNFLTKLLKPK